MSALTVLDGKTGGPKEDHFIATTTNNLIIDLAKIQMQIKAEGSALRRLQKSVGDAKKTRDGIIDELTKRAVEEHNLPLPMGQTLQSLFEGGEQEDDA